MYYLRLAALALSASSTVYAQHQLQYLSADIPVAGGHFGSKVEMGGDFAAIQHLGGGTMRQLYLYRRAPVQLELEQIIHAPIGSFSFGISIAFDGTTLVVGDSAAFNQGRVYVYERTAGQWSLVDTLRTQLNESGGHFGSSVDIDGDTIVAGAHGENLNGILDGYAYFFERTPAGQWQQVARVRPQDAEMDSTFGRQVALEGDLAVISSPVGSGGVQG